MHFSSEVICIVGKRVNSSFGRIIWNDLFLPDLIFKICKVFALRDQYSFVLALNTGNNPVVKTFPFYPCNLWSLLLHSWCNTWDFVSTRPGLPSHQRLLERGLEEKQSLSQGRTSALGGRGGRLFLPEQRYELCTPRLWCHHLLWSLQQNNVSPSDVVQWSNHRVMEWLRSVDLAEYAPNLRGSGVHGGLIVRIYHCTIKNG